MTPVRFIVTLMCVTSFMTSEASTIRGTFADNFFKKRGSQSAFLDCPEDWSTPHAYRQCCEGAAFPRGCECFDTSVNSPFKNILTMKPKCPADNNDVVWKLYINEDQSDLWSDITASKVLSNQSDYIGGLKTYFVVHGWTKSADVDWVQGVKDELLKLGPSNVVLVDWRHGAQAYYPQAIANTRVVAAMTARLILSMFEQGTEPHDVHLIGMSLGAQTCALIGQEVHRLTSKLLGRITGLDPAGPLYNKRPDVVILDSSDAHFVDIIHTNAGGKGVRDSTGHVDFWPNDGHDQPGCAEVDWDVNMGPFDLMSLSKEVMASLSCSHLRAPDLFQVSIGGECEFQTETPDCPMGFHARADCRGVYFLNTTASWPFC